MRMDQRARDFWRVRAGKQQQQVLKDQLLHEYTSVTQYIQWHNNVGARLPSFLRGTAKCIAHDSGKQYDTTALDIEVDFGLPSDYR